MINLVVVGRVGPGVQVEAVRQMHAAGRNVTDIAEMFSVSRPLIYRVLEGAQTS